MFWRGENQMIFTSFVSKNLLRSFLDNEKDKIIGCISHIFPYFSYISMRLYFKYR